MVDVEEEWQIIDEALAGSIEAVEEEDKKDFEMLMEEPAGASDWEQGNSEWECSADCMVVCGLVDPGQTACMAAGSSCLSSSIAWSHATSTDKAEACDEQDKGCHLLSGAEGANHQRASPELQHRCLCFQVFSLHGNLGPSDSASGCLHVAVSCESSLAELQYLPYSEQEDSGCSDLVADRPRDAEDKLCPQDDEPPIKAVSPTSSPRLLNGASTRRCPSWLFQWVLPSAILALLATRVGVVWRRRHDIHSAQR